MTTQPLAPAPPRHRPREDLALALRDDARESPYKGLGYYEQDDAPFFFGREQETQVVTANLMASRLTVLYGKSGVGKSSLLRAGAARHLMEIAAENVARRGTPRLVVAVLPGDDGAVRTTWRDDPVPAILGAIERAVASLGLDIAGPPPGKDLCAQLAAWTELLGSDLLIILDQFEEYLLYHEGEDGPGTLAAELPRAVLQNNLRANFLISIREDMLARLDAFKRRIPTIFDNCVRINHLDRDRARAAIEKPIDIHNDIGGSARQTTIEPQLVDTLLRELESGQVVVGLAGVGASDEAAHADEHPIETPYLQLVMTRLWREEMRVGSSVLRLTTLERLGNSERIVKTHLDGTMRTLPRYARYVAARAFHHLVTPSGSKIAHSPADLAAYTGLDAHDIEPVLARLTEPEYRILRRVALSTVEDAPARFEIFHDVLGTPVLDWRSRYLRAREVLETVRGGTTTLLLIAFGLVSSIALLGFALSEGSPTNTLWVAWSASALMLWVSTVIVLARRRQRREAWAVPLVGIVAAGIGPVLGLALATNGAIALASIGRRRLGHLPARARASRARATGGVRRFAGVLSVVGAVVLVLACVLPTVEFYFYSDAVGPTYPEEPDALQHLLASDERVWFALSPLTCAVLALVAGLLALARPRPRPFLMGLVSGLGISVLAYFFSLLWWTDALTPYVGGQFETYGSVAGGPLLGLGGAGIVLVSAAPLVAVEIFASIIGAGRVMRGRTLQASGVDLERARSAMRVPVGVLGAVGAALALAAMLMDSAAWGRTAKDSLFDVSFWAGLQVAVPSAVAAIAVAVVVFADRVNQRAAGQLAGCGIALVVFFTGVFGSMNWQPPSGAYVGVAAGVALLLAGALGFAARCR